MAGKTIKLFLTDGDPNGLVVAELQQWTGIALSCPRTKLGKLSQRDEAKKPGVYILIGQSPETELPIAYIGEAENVGKRMGTHSRQLDFWDRICFFTQKDDNLTKGHVRYLEARMIQVAQQAKRMSLENKDNPDPQKIPLPESDVADMEYFLTQMQMILPIMGVNLLRPQPTMTSNKDSADSGESTLFEMKSKDAHATAMLIDDEFVVSADSVARKKTVPSLSAYTERLRQQLLETGVLADAGEKQYRFTQDHAFTSPSAAAATISGRPANGRVEWKVKATGQTYAQWEESQIVETPSGPQER
jgi:hypothetical protein